MTTTVDTTVRPDVDIAAWLDGEIELPCEVYHPGGRACAEIHPDSFAEWIAFISHPCGHFEPRAKLLCDHCHMSAATGELACSTPCPVLVVVRYIERLRGGAA